ncbi:DUF1194 domain-containing protein [Roseovarius sp. 2305UL8-3]|uniref:DUF1194 domain-containing protein n=1 Tax=Roseovarius conchicola TaxID=3121636 RepID=UPI00352799AD
MLRFLLSGLGLAALPARACEVALVLAVDVSGSVDRGEYRIQMQGLADGLRDGAVSEALVAGEAALTVVHWTGTSRQSIAVPWAQITSFDALEKFAAAVETAPRRWRNYSTAIGEALVFAHDQFAAVPGCKRRIIDISGDGSSNEGIHPRAVHGRLLSDEITVNALVIEGAEPDMTGYYWENVITGPGAFVITANSYADYPDRMRRKLQREVAKQVSDAHSDDVTHVRFAD